MFPTKSNGDGSIVASDVDWSYPPIGATIVAFGKTYEVILNDGREYVVTCWQASNAKSVTMNILSWSARHFLADVTLASYPGRDRILVEASTVDQTLASPCPLCFAPIGKPCTGETTRVDHAVDRQDGWFIGAIHPDAPMGSSSAFVYTDDYSSFIATATLTDDVPIHHTYRLAERLAPTDLAAYRNPLIDLRYACVQSHRVWNPRSGKAWVFSCVEGTQRRLRLGGRAIPFIYAKHEGTNLLSGLHFVGVPAMWQGDGANAATHPLVWVIDGSKIDAQLMALVKADRNYGLANDLSAAWSHEVKRRSAALKKPVVGRQVYCESQFDTHDDLD